MAEYKLGDKTFFVDEVDMHRVASKKIDKAAQKLPAEKREQFLKVFEILEELILWERFTAHVEDSLQSPSPSTKRGNIYDLQEGINKLAKKVSNWVLRNQNIDDKKVREYVVQLVGPARSICRYLDANATCWDVRALVTLNKSS